MFASSCPAGLIATVGRKEHAPRHLIPRAHAIAMRQLGALAAPPNKKPGVTAGLDIREVPKASGRLQIAGGLLAALRDDFVADLLTFDQRAHASTLDRGDVHEHILRAVIRLDEAVAFLGIEELHSSGSHQ
jgi:hypothetical protein